MNDESEIKVDADKAIISTEADQLDQELPPHSVNFLILIKHSLIKILLISTMN